jgi:hypothetical protein
MRNSVYDQTEAMNCDDQLGTATRARACQITANSAEVSLRDPITCRFALAESAEGHCVRQSVCVEFPDDVRSLFEALSWRGGACVVACMTCVGRRYVEQALSVAFAPGRVADTNEIVLRPLFLEIRAMCSEFFAQELRPECAECRVCVALCDKPRDDDVPS